MDDKRPDHRTADAGWVAALVLLLAFLVNIHEHVPAAAAAAALPPAAAGIWFVNQPGEQAKLGGLLLMELSVAISAAVATPPAGIALWLFPIVAVLPSTITTPWMRSVAAGGAVAAFLGSELLSGEPLSGGEIYTILDHLLSVGGALFVTFRIAAAAPFTAP